MSEPNQRKKPAPRPSKKKLRETEKPKPISFREQALINRTEPPKAEPQSVEGIISEKFLTLMMEALIKQFHQFLESFGGYYSKAALMEMFDISSKNTLNNWMKEKGLPYYKIDNKVLIKKSELEEFLKPYRKVMSVVVVYFYTLPEIGDVLMMAA